MHIYKKKTPHTPTEDVHIHIQNQCQPVHHRKCTIKHDTPTVSTFASRGQKYTINTDQLLAIVHIHVEQGLFRVRSYGIWRC